MEKSLSGHGTGNPKAMTEPTAKLTRDILEQKIAKTEKTLLYHQEGEQSRNTEFANGSKLFAKHRAEELTILRMALASLTPPSDAEVERVARAIADAQGDPCWHEPFATAGRHLTVEAATAAIKAMQEKP